MNKIIDFFDEHWMATLFFSLILLGAILLWGAIEIQEYTPCSQLGGLAISDLPARCVKYFNK